MIKLKTVRKLAAKGHRSLFRVRWRMLEYDAEAKTNTMDTDGAEGKPDTWSRWEAEYCLTQRAAEKRAADKRGYHAKVPDGVIDRGVSARELAARFEGESELEGGLFRVIYEQVEYNDRRGS